MPHSLNNHQSLKKEQEKSEAQHSISGWQKDDRFSLESIMKVITLKSSYCRGPSLGLDKKTRLVFYTHRRRLCKV